MEERICRITGKKFTIWDQEKEMYEQWGVPLSDLHPVERLRAPSAYWNTFNLYWTKDARTGQRILTNFDPEHFPVIYEGTYWMSADFDPREYGREFDFSRPFFEQWHELFLAVPKPSLTLFRCEDCSYCNYSIGCKHCYLTFNSLESENVHYSSLAFQCRDSIELFACTRCELCFHCIQSEDCYRALFVDFSARCTDSAFLYNCQDCAHCYQCSNIKNKHYCIRNEQYSQEEYNKMIERIDLQSFRVLEEETAVWNRFLADQPFRAERVVNCENSDGTMLRNCHDCHNCFNLSDGENNVNSYGQQLYDSVDASGWEGAHHLMRSGGILSSRDIAFSMIIEHSFTVWYSMFLYQSHDCFGCYGLRKSEYCILNKQYTKDEYESLRARIIDHMKQTGEWGQYWPLSMSPYYYDDEALFFFPIDDELTKKLGARRRPVQMSHDEGMSIDLIPDHLGDFDDQWHNKTFLCKRTQRAFKITPQEGALHKKLRVALPRIAWHARLEDNFKLVFILPHEAHCAECGKEFSSLIDPSETARPLWCDACYLRESG
ncbi:MAG: hypothetical protein Q8P56_05360 [Candidatus Uhrbacteria bacterium]|nr:hypothetical protein [Candidatus Uhrbacteria bacterium]